MPRRTDHRPRREPTLGVTLGELVELVEQATRAQTSLSTPVDLDVSWSGRITAVTVRGDAEQ